MRENHEGIGVRDSRAKGASEASWPTTPRSAAILRVRSTTESANIRSIHNYGAVRMNRTHRKSGGAFVSGMPSY